VKVHFKMSALQRGCGGEKCLKIRFVGWVEQDESVCAGERFFIFFIFYQLQTVSGSPVWDCPPNPAFHRKLSIKSKRKPARRHFTLGEQLFCSLSLFLFLSFFNF